MGRFCHRTADANRADGISGECLSSPGAQLPQLPIRAR